MYGKIFSSIYDGTLVEHWEALVTFEQMIILCDADGVLDVTPQALHNRTGIPLDIILTGIPILEAPDPRSRNPSEDGCRIVRLDEHRDWGWRLVNHEQYKNLTDSDTKREQNRERQRRFREKHRNGDVMDDNGDVTDVTLGNAPSRHTDTDTYKDQYRSNDLFEQWWSAYPKKVKKKNAHDIWKRKRLDTKAPTLVADVEARLTTDRRWRDGFVPDPTTYLNGERWNDAIEPTKAPPSTDNLRFVS